MAGFESAGEEEKDSGLTGYLNELRTKEHILEVREGEKIALESYTVPADSPDDFLINGVTESIVKYLNCPLVRDDFEVHAERVTWFNDSGLFKKYGSDFYFQNKLRLNKIQGPQLWMENLIVPRTQKRFNNPDFFGAIEPAISIFNTDFPVYGKGTVAENLKYVESFVELLKKILNAMIEYGLVEGMKV